MKTSAMSDYNRGAKAYWAVMVVAGSAACVWAVQGCASLNAMQWAEFAGLLSLVILASSNPVRIPSTNSSVTATILSHFLRSYSWRPAGNLIGWSTRLSVHGEQLNARPVGSRARDDGRDSLYRRQTHSILVLNALVSLLKIRWE